MRKYLAIALGCLLAACATVPQSTPSSPSVVADRAVLDEQVALSVELAYKASRLAMETAVDAGLLKGARASQAAALDNKAFSAVQSVRSAYRAGNATNYLDAAREARAAMGEMIALIR